MQNKQACGERYLLLKYEDLVTATEEMMRQVQDFLKIAHDASTLSPTRIAKDYRMNSAYSEDSARVSGVVTTQLDKYKDKLSPDEIGLVESLLGPVMTQLGYAPIIDEREIAASTGSMRRSLKQRFNTTELNRVRKSFEHDDYRGIIAQPVH